jgi:hypothetical protein
VVARPEIQEEKIPMQSILTRSGPGLLVVGAAAALGYAVLMPSDAPRAQAAASEIANHGALCMVCRLPLYGAEKKPSKNGAESNDQEYVNDTTR